MGLLFAAMSVSHLKLYLARTSPLANPPVCLINFSSSPHVTGTGENRSAVGNQEFLKKGLRWNSPTPTGGPSNCICVLVIPPVFFFEKRASLEYP